MQIYAPEINFFHLCEDGHVASSRTQKHTDASGDRWCHCERCGEPFALVQEHWLSRFFNTGFGLILASSVFLFTLAAFVDALMGVQP